MKGKLLIFIFLVISLGLWGQTMPSLFDLSTGSYTFTNWDSNEPAGTYPANMRFHRTGTQDPGLSVEMTNDYTAAYNLTSGTRINGMGDDGITFVNTSSSGNLGAAVVGLNATGRENIQVSWLGGTHTQTDGNRVYAIRLQYRIGTGNWTDVPGPVEYSSSGQSAGHTQIFGPTTLPAACNNQPTVYLRWKYYSVSGSGGTRPRLRLDDITVSSSPAATNSITTGVVSAPPFCVDASNSASGTVAYSATGTYSGATFTALLSDATGSFTSPTSVGSASVSGTDPSGSINITIPAGTPSGTGYKIRIDSDNPVVTGSESSAFEIINGAKNVSGQNASAGNQQITVSWTNPSGCFDEIMIVARAGSAVTATPTGDGSAYTANLTYGSGTAFDGGYVVYKGTSSPQTITGLVNFTTYYFTLFTRRGTNWSSGVTVSQIPAATPALTEVILPQYIQGLNGTNNNRVPFAYRLTLSNLLPNATYRYVNQIVVSSDGPTTNGAGNVIYVNSDNTFTRATTTGLATPGQYGEFTTDASGSFTGWFITEPTGNERFTPGNDIYVRVRLNDGAGGSTAVTYLTTANSIKVINFGTSNNANEGTGIYGDSYSAAKNFVFLYDNVSGTGRPITSTFVENDGTSGGTTYIGYYQNNVDGQNGRWGAIIPNVNANGIRRVEYRGLAGGGLVYAVTDSDGNWNGVNTSNPTGGTTPLVLPHNFVDDLTIASGSAIEIPSNGTLTVNGLLTNNGTLTLRSNASGTASLIHYNNDVPAVVERYIPGSSEDWHLLSSPVENQPISGSFTPSGSYPDGSGYDFYAWDEPNSIWRNQKNSNNNITHFVPGKGYLVAYQATNPTLTFSGELNAGMVDFPMTTSGTGGWNAYNLAGNPYPCAIDWKASQGWDRSNLEVSGGGYSMWIWNDAAGQYGSYNSASVSNTGTHGTSRFIAPMQGFFVKASSAGNLSMNADVKVHNNQDFLKADELPADYLHLRVTTPEVSYSDEVIVEFHHESDQGGARKLMSFFQKAPALYIPKNGVFYSIDFRSVPREATVIPLSFRAGVNGTYTLQALTIESFAPGVTITLEDRKTGTFHPLHQNPAYSFTATTGDNQDRFLLHFAGAFGVEEPYHEPGIHIYSYDHTIYLNSPVVQQALVSLYRINGQQVFSRQITLNGTTTIPVDLPAGWYVVRVITDGIASSRKVFIW